jgi:hypothetical protein
MYDWGERQHAPMHFSHRYLHFVVCLNQKMRFIPAHMAFKRKTSAEKLGECVIYNLLPFARGEKRQNLNWTQLQEDL